MTQTVTSVRQLNWWLMLIPLAGVAVSLGIYRAELAVRPPATAPALANAPAATRAADPKHASKPGKNRKRHKEGTPPGPFFASLQNILDSDCVAPVIIGTAAAVFIVRAVSLQSALFAVLALLTAGFTFRELRDVPGLQFMSWGVKVVAAAAGVLAYVYRRQVRDALVCDRRGFSWLAATFFAYVVAILIGKRAFSFIPGEHSVHRSLEECAETAAHVMFVATSLLAAWRRPASPAAAPPGV